MKNFSLLSVLAVTFFLISCDGSDDPVVPAVPPHEVGTWEIDGYAFVNLPSTHTAYEGFELTLAQTFGSAAENLVLDLKEDSSYNLTLVLTGRLDSEGSGKWSIDNGDDADDVSILTLSPTGSTNKINYDIRKNADDRLELLETIKSNLFSDAVLEANNFRIDSLASLPIEEQNKLLTTVRFNQLSVYKRQ